MDIEEIKTEEESRIQIKKNEKLSNYYGLALVAVITLAVLFFVLLFEYELLVV